MTTEKFVPRFPEASPHWDKDHQEKWNLLIRYLEQDQTNRILTEEPVTAFTSLTDTPTSYTGNANKFLAVTTTEDGLAYVTPSAVSGVTAEFTSLAAPE